MSKNTQETDSKSVSTQNGQELSNRRNKKKRDDRAFLKKLNHDILDTLPEGLAYATLGGKVIFVNRALENILGIPRNRLIGRKIPDLVKELLDPADHEPTLVRLQNVSNDNKIGSFDIKYKDKILEVCPGVSSTTKRLTATIRDITDTVKLIEDSKRIENKLLENKNDLSRLFDITLHLLESVQSKVLIQKIADQAANLVGSDTSAIYLLRDDNIVLEATSPHLPENFPDEFRLARLENHPHILKVIETAFTLTIPDSSKEKWTKEETEIITTRNLGSMVYIPLFIQKKVSGVIILGTINRTHNFGQHEIEMFTTYSNITSLALENSYLFENLVSTKEKAEESNRLKSAFLHNISHEIRTPLNAIIGFSDLLGSDNLKPDLRREYINIIGQSNNQLLSIINDILDISYIEAGQINVNLSEVKINPLLRRLYVQYQSEASVRKLEFRLKNTLESQELSFCCDEAKLIGILTNLINNAFKFTHQGSVEFGCKCSGNSIQFFVRDTGIGIDKSEQPNIFDRFYQIDQGHDRLYGGMGLGLSICAAYTEILGGQIQVDSEAGKGSLFTVTLPFNEAIGASENFTKPKRATEKSDSGKILVAEDDDTNYAFIEAVLNESGYQIMRAVNGLDAIQKCSMNDDIKLILMDVRMPVKDGYSSAKEISKLRPQLPIIFQTAYDLPENNENFAGLNYSGFLSKPFTSHQLVSIVENSLKPAH